MRNMGHTLTYIMSATPRSSGDCCLYYCADTVTMTRRYVPSRLYDEHFHPIMSTWSQCLPPWGSLVILIVCRVSRELPEFRGVTRRKLTINKRPNLEILCVSPLSWCSKFEVDNVRVVVDGQETRRDLLTRNLTLLYQDFSHRRLSSSVKHHYFFYQRHFY